MEATAGLLGGEGPTRIADLGTGGGVPGLVLALAFPQADSFFIESMVKRAGFLRRAVEELGLARITVLELRAEVAGRDPAYRGTFDLVTARSFGAPAVVAECGAPLLRVEGYLLVSEPPDNPPERWPAPNLAELGLGPAAVVSAEPRLVAMRQEAVCPARFPRRVGMPAKRPLFWPS